MGNAGPEGEMSGVVRNSEGPSVAGGEVRVLRGGEILRCPVDHCEDYGSCTETMGK